MQQIQGCDTQECEQIHAEEDTTHTVLSTCTRTHTHTHTHRHPSPCPYCQPLAHCVLHAWKHASTVSACCECCERCVCVYMCVCVCVWPPAVSFCVSNSTKPTIRPMAIPNARCMKNSAGLRPQSVKLRHASTPRRRRKGAGACKDTHTCTHTTPFLYVVQT